MIRRFVTIAVAAGAVALAAPAFAVGTGGVELTPLQGGQEASSFHVHLAPGASSRQTFILRNGSAQPQTFQLYAAGVVRSTSGGFTVGESGTAPWIGLRTQTVTLAPQATRKVDFTVRRDRSQRGPVAYGAVVMAQADHMVVSRAAAMVYLERPGRDVVSRAVLPVVIALAVIGCGVAAQVWTRRRRRARAKPA